MLKGIKITKKSGDNDEGDVDDKDKAKSRNHD